MIDQDPDEAKEDSDLLDSQMLMGDRKNIEITNLFTQALYKALPAVMGPPGHVEGMTLTVSLQILRQKDKKSAMTGLK